MNKTSIEKISHGNIFKVNSNEKVDYESYKFTKDEKDTYVLFVSDVKVLECYNKILFENLIDSYIKFLINRTS